MLATMLIGVNVRKEPPAKESIATVNIRFMTVTYTQQLHKFGAVTADGEFRVAISCLGAHISIVLPDASWIDDLAPRLPQGWAPSKPAEPSEEDISYRSKSYLIPPASDLTAYGGRVSLAETLTRDIEYAIAERSERYVFIHAGVVAVDGKAMIFPGESHSGKSTLVAALVHQGATYYSDEYAVVTIGGLVLPFPRRIALRNDFIHARGRTDLSAHAPSLQVAQSGIPASQVMFFTYEPDHEWLCKPLDPVSAFIELCKNTVGFRSRPVMSFEYLHRLAADTHCYQGTRADAEEAARLILN